MNYAPIQLKLPVDMARIIKINDPVYSFSEVMAHIDLKKYFVEKEHETGRPRYDREKLLKIVLFAFMEFGYCSVRFIQKLCETDIRFLWLLDEENAPSHMTINNFIHNELSGSLEDIFNDINRYMFEQLGVDLDHAYIDGTKIEANANKYTWVWKKSCIKSRNNVFGKLSALLEDVNAFMALYQRAVFEVRQEYAVEYVKYILDTFLEASGIRDLYTVHLHPLVEAVDIRRGVQTGTVPGFPKKRCGHSSSAALTVGTCNMDKLQFLFRIAHLFQQSLGSSQSGNTAFPAYAVDILNCFRCVYKDNFLFSPAATDRSGQTHSFSSRWPGSVLLLPA